MPRIAGVLVSAALMLSLSGALARAGGLTFTQPRLDLGAQVMMELFGETADSTASLGAQDGDRSSESPLRELALRVPAAGGSGSAAGGAHPAALAQHIALSNLSGVEASYLAAAVNAGLLSTSLRFAPIQSPQPQGPAMSQSQLFTAAYQPVAPAPVVSPGPGTLAFDSPAQAPLAATKESTFTLNPDDRDAKSGLSLNFSGQYDRSNLQTATGLPAATLAAPQWQLPDGNASLAIPDYAGQNRLSLGAGLAVPVFHGVTLNLRYDAQRSYGGDALPGLENLDSANNLYAGKLTYQIPSSSSSLSISAYQNRYGESVLPLNGFTQTGENVNFTVKF